MCEKFESNLIEAYNLHMEKFVNCELLMNQSEVRYDISLLSAEDLHLFNEGCQFRLYQKLGSHVMNIHGISGTYFAVWAPNARRVSVIGNFNNWNNDSHNLMFRDKSGIWEGFIPNVGKGAYYKYHIRSSKNNYEVEKADPLGFYNEVPPRTASCVWDLDYKWSDQMWMAGQKEHNSLSAPISIYEVHLGSWRRVPEDNNRSLSYQEIAPLLADYVKDLGFTHVEFLPLMEHPFFGSWGYQTTGYFAPTSRYGSPQDLMYLVNYLHNNGIGVILDWVPSHFPDNEFGLNFFDGTHLYEDPDPNRGFHKDWKSLIFNYGKKEVQSFLISSALFWLDHYHADAIRVDGVASMLYLDYSRNPGEWVPNKYGGKENLEALDFIKNLNEQAYKFYPSIQTFAEESTSWPLVSRPIYAGWVLV
jgi:1,4-alpha-glucan branching enzyme